MKEGWDQLVLVGAQLRAEEIPELFLLGVVAVGHMDQAGLWDGEWDEECVFKTGMRKSGGRMCGCIVVLAGGKQRSAQGGARYIPEPQPRSSSTAIRVSPQVSERAGGCADREQGPPVHADLLQRLGEGLRQLHVRGHEQAGQHQRQHHPLW